MIKVVGLGCKEDQITLAGVKAIQSASKVYIKTALTETYKYFQDNNIDVISFDYVYEKAEDFANLDQEIVETLLKEENACLCVNGSGFEDRAVIELQKRTKVEIIPSVSLGALYESPALNKTRISAYELTTQKGFNYDTRGTLIIVDVDNEYIASDVKLVLSNILGDDQDIRFNDRIIKVYEIDRQKEYNYKTTIIVDPIELTKKQRFNFMDLYQIMVILRSENGCEWDKAQTHESIRANIIEEAYELVEAINNQDIDNMIEESGDLMLQSIFHCIIGEDLGEYNTEDALSAICSKLIFRHPHIFGDIKANNVEEALASWDAAKAKEKHYTSLSSKMDSITKALPALIKANKMLSVLKKANVKFESSDEALQYFQEKLDAFKSVCEENEAGDLLLATIWLLKTNGLDPEIVLDKTTSKIINNFKELESKDKLNSLSKEEILNQLEGTNED